MDDKKYQVFISSTYKDLEQARDKVTETILNLYHIPIGMEMFSAGDDEQWEIIRGTIDKSDYYVVILGHRYGTVDENGISYTEKEYDYAKEKGIPILAFIRDREIATKAHERDNATNYAERLDSFIQKASKNKMCDFWTNIDDLATKVAIALPKTFSQKPQVGWVRSSEAMSKEMSIELAELSSENRSLRDKITNLEKLVNDDKPLIEVDTEGSDNLVIQRSNLFYNKLISMPEKLDFSAVPDELREYTSEDEIVQYNNEIPSADDVEGYNSQKKLFFLAHNESVNPSFRVSNRGTVKANDIFVTLEFPEFVKIIAFSEKRNISDPKIEVPESPIEKAKEKHAENSPFNLKMAGIGSVLSQGHLSTISALGSLAIDSELPRFKPISAHLSKFGSSVRDNTVTFRIDSLIHTRDHLFEDDIVIIPMEIGEGNIEVSIICEEYKIQDEFEVPIAVVSKD